MIGILSLVMSLLALGFTLYQHLVYGRKIEKQQMQLNQLELEKHQKEKEDAPEEYNRILPDIKGLNALIQEAD